MPAKTTSPEAEQKKLWKAEARNLEKTRSKIRRDFRVEQKRLIKASEAAHQAVTKFMARAEKQLPKLEADIDRRLGILNGRIHSNHHQIPESPDHRTRMGLGRLESADIRNC